MFDKSLFTSVLCNGLTQSVISKEFIMYQFVLFKTSHSIVGSVEWKCSYDNEKELKPSSGQKNQSCAENEVSLNITQL